MKKFLLTVIFLCLICNVKADIISFTQFDNSTTISQLNTAVNTIFTDFNGNISGVNIKSNTISDDEMSTPLKMSNWYKESIGNWTYSGMLPVTSTTLISNISAGVSFMNGVRLETGATSKTYTASKDTWVYIDQNGAFQYSEVANNAAQPTTPANSLLLAKVVTSGTAITSVTDSRQTVPPNLRVYSDLKSGLVISRDTTTSTTITIGSGEIEFGSSITSGKRRNTSSVNVNFTTTGRGGIDTGSIAANTYYYIFALADDANSTNYEGIASLSSTDATGVTGERLVGWCFANSTTSISPDSIGAYRGLGGDAPNIVKRKSTNQDSTAAVVWTDVPELETRFYSSGRPAVVMFKSTNIGNNNSTNPEFILAVDSVIQNDTYSAQTVTQKSTDGYYLWPTTNYIWSGTLSVGEHLIKPQYRAIAGNTGYVVSRDVIIIEQ